MPETLEMPDGSVFEIITSPADPALGVSEIEFTVLPDGPAPPPHVHPRQTETFTGLEGDTFELMLDGEWRPLAVGESVTVQPRQVHTFRNRGAGTVRVRTAHDPGLSFERYIRRLHATAVAHGSKRITPAMMMRMAVLWHEHADTIQPGPPPLRVAMGGLSLLGRLIGTRPAA